MTTETADKSIADILHEAREYLESHGWVRGVLEAGDGRVCLWGSVVISQGWNEKDHFTPKEAIRLNEAARKVQLVCGSGDIPHWNDTVCPSQQRALDVLAKAEKLALGLDPDAL